FPRATPGDAGSPTIMNEFCFSLFTGPLPPFSGPAVKHVFKTPRDVPAGRFKRHGSRLRENFPRRFGKKLEPAVKKPGFEPRKLDVLHERIAVVTPGMEHDR